MNLYTGLGPVGHNGGSRDVMVAVGRRRASFHIPLYRRNVPVRHGRKFLSSGRATSTIAIIADRAATAAIAMAGERSERAGEVEGINGGPRGADSH